MLTPQPTACRRRWGRRCIYDRCERQPLTGWCGLATVALWLGQFPLWTMIGSVPPVYDGEAFAERLLSIKNVAFTRILMDQGLFVTMMVFAAGLRHLI